MDARNAYSFKVQLPSFYTLQQVDFYFTYMDQAGNSYRDPESKNYKFQYGDLFISLNLSLTSVNYTLSNNYPNPFNSTTTIKFIAEGNFPAELSVYDALGRKVKTLFKGITHKGIYRER